MSKLSSFFHHHGAAVHAIADILGTAFNALPISPVDREAVDAALTDLHKIGDEIQSAAPEVSKALDASKGAVAKVTKADIVSAVAPMLETALADLVAATVAKALAAATAEGK